MTDLPWNKNQFTLMTKFVLHIKIKTLNLKRHNWLTK